MQPRSEVFKKCAACHTINQGGAGGIGPNLYATMGEAIAQGKAGFAFSDALKAVGGTWDWDKMNAWLTSAQIRARHQMTFAGLSNPQDRANVILYLNQQGSNLPLPATPAAKEPAAGDATANSRCGGQPSRGGSARRYRVDRQYRHACAGRALGRSAGGGGGPRRR
jgi:cytochrome c